MLIESSVTSLSWIPREAITGPVRVPLDLGIGHYDPPPPDRLEDLNALRLTDRFRFANQLKAWIEVEDGRIVDGGYSGGGVIGSTTLRLAARQLTIAAVPFPDVQRPPEYGETSCRFVQTAGGRTGAPMPRRVSRPPYLQVTAPTAWSTLALTLHVDGTAECELVGASPFPRHWVYDAAGHLVAKTGLIDFRRWSRDHFGDHTPWGGIDSQPVVSRIESALERALSTHILRDGAKARWRRLRAGDVLVRQGDPGDELFLLMDGVLAVEIDEKRIVEVGPGSIVGERAIVEDGIRTATLRAVTAARVAVVSADQVDRAALEAIAASRRIPSPT